MKAKEKLRHEEPKETGQLNATRDPGQDLKKFNGEGITETIGKTGANSATSTLIFW